VFAGKEVFVREPTAAALEALVAKARSENIQLRVLSGFRPFDHQRKLYFDALAQRGPKQNGTALPGHSEHQLGTTVDFCGLNIRAHLNGSFASTPEGQFLQREASNFGFRNSYTAENSEESGFKPEPWHWRHIQDVRGVQVP
jgi:D-alanyl-D-alanine carboxypeptidase